MNKILLAAFGTSLIILTACSSSSTGGDNSDTAVLTVPTPEKVVLSENAVVKTGESIFLTYNEADFEAALTEGKDVFLDFHADWCPLCRSNLPNIEDAFDEVGNGNLIGFQVNFDTETSLRKQFKIFSQSQLVLIPGGDVENAVVYPPGLYSKEKVLAILNS